MTSPSETLIWIAQLILAGVGGATVALSLAAYLGKRFVDIQVGRAIATHTAELQQRTDALKIELGISAHEQRVGLSRIDAQRSDAMLSIWSTLNSWHEVLISTTAPNLDLVVQNPADAIERYRIWASQLLDYADSLSIEVRKRAILFDEDTYQVISRCGLAINNESIQFMADVTKAARIAPGKELKHLGQIDVARARLEVAAAKNSDEFRREILDQFRVLMKAQRD